MDLAQPGILAVPGVIHGHRALGDGVDRVLAQVYLGFFDRLVPDGQRVEAVVLPPSYDPTQGELTVQIDPSLMDDQEMLEDIVTAAVNDAVNRIATTTQDRMSDMTAGINLPPGMKLPF